MQDIYYHMKSFDLKKNIIDRVKIDSDFYDVYEKFISTEPYIFQLETTNVCNMKCIMCPRTSKMTRKVGHMNLDLYQEIIDQCEPYSPIQLLKWKYFLYWDLFKSGLLSDKGGDFFHYEISVPSLTLHGFGDPLLDPHIVERIRICSRKRIQTYFSCNPINMNDDLFLKLLDAGIDYLKYSLDDYSDENYDKYRGRKIAKEDVFKNIDRHIEMIKKGGYQTVLVLTMLEFSGNLDESEKFYSTWQDKDVFAYVKKTHHRWLYDEEETPDNTAYYMRFFCEYPFSSMSILYDGTVVPCPLDYDGAVPLGNVKESSLKSIWNSEKFKKFRKMHIKGEIPKGHFCRSQCEIPILGDKII